MIIPRHELPNSWMLPECETIIEELTEDIIQVIGAHYKIESNKNRPFKDFLNLWINAILHALIHVAFRSIKATSEYVREEDQQELIQEYREFLLTIIQHYE